MKDYEWRQVPAVAATVTVSPFLVKGTTKLVDELTSQDFSKADNTFHDLITYRGFDGRNVTRSTPPQSSILQGTSPLQGRKSETFSPMHQSPSSDFWTGGSRRQSPASSMNSSLHGRPTFDPQEQNPTFLINHGRNSSASLVTSPALPPPPVELGKVLTFDCDICGQKVQVERRLEWQWVVPSVSLYTLTH